MFIVLISWVYIAAVCMIIGFAFDALWKKLTGFSFPSPEMFFLSGMALIGAYAQIYSLFSGVGRSASLLLAAGCAAAVVLLRKDIMDRTKALCLRWGAGLRHGQAWSLLSAL